MIKIMIIMNDVGAMSLAIQTRLDLKGFSSWERDKLRKGARMSLSKQDVGVVSLVIHTRLDFKGFPLGETG
jgi:hypothetical protein